MIDLAPLLDEVIDVDPGVWTYGGPTRCRLRLFRDVGGAPLAVVTELAENRGLSVTNAAEYVWRTITRRLDTTKFTMIEHYGPALRLRPRGRNVRCRYGRQRQAIVAADQRPGAVRLPAAWQDQSGPGPRRFA